MQLVLNEGTTVKVITEDGKVLTGIVESLERKTDNVIIVLTKEKQK